jgi:hypothetical protein
MKSGTHNMRQYVNMYFWENLRAPKKDVEDTGDTTVVFV